jgi:hypothetical protein
VYFADALTFVPGLTRRFTMIGFFAGEALARCATKYIDLPEPYKSPASA